MKMQVTGSCKYLVQISVFSRKRITSGKLCQNVNYHKGRPWDDGYGGLAWIFFETVRKISENVGHHG